MIIKTEIQSLRYFNSFSIDHLECFLFVFKIFLLQKHLKANGINLKEKDTEIMAISGIYYEKEFLLLWQTYTEV